MNHDPRVWSQPPLPGDTGAFPPPPRHGFQGRDAELGRLEAELGGHRAVWIHAVQGMGKSALAREAAQRWARTGLYLDGACWVSFERGSGVDHIVNVLGAHLEATGFSNLPPVERALRARQLFDERSVLMVWNRVEKLLEHHAEEERRGVIELLRDWTATPHGRGRLILTSAPVVEESDIAAGIPETGELTLGGLAPEDALAVLGHQEADSPAARYSRRSLEVLVEAVAGHPLSLEIVASLLKDSTPEEITAELKELQEALEGGVAGEGRRAVQAPLEFAARRLGEAARQAFGWLSLFRGGVFESLWLGVSGIEPETWDSLRGELESMGLVRAEQGAILHEDRPYLDLHPALASRAAVGPAEDDVPIAEVHERLVEAYHRLTTSLWQVLFHSRGGHRGLDLMVREEGNYRTAARWAIQRGALHQAAELGDLLGEYLQRTGRPGERQRWMAGHAAEMGRCGYNEEMARQEHAAAWALFNHGRAAEAVVRLEGLLARLRGARDFDAAELLATSRLDLGRLYHSRGHANRAVGTLEEAAAEWQDLVERRRSRDESTAPQERKVAATFSSLAGVRRSLGDADGAVECWEKVARLAAGLGEHGQSALALAQMAEILSQQQRFETADERYGQALEAARRAADRRLEAVLLQHRGSLAEERERDTRAAECYQRALELFHQLDDGKGFAETCNLLGVLGQKTGHLEPARAWCEKARQLARELDEPEVLSVAAQSLGTIGRRQGESELEQGNEAAARRCFENAAASIEECLEVQKESGDRSAAAASHSQLAQLLLLLDQAEQAMAAAHEARQIREQLGVGEVWQDYHTLAAGARARGDEAAAREWEGKRDAVLGGLE